MSQGEIMSQEIQNNNIELPKDIPNNSVDLLPKSVDKRGLLKFYDKDTHIVELYNWKIEVYVKENGNILPHPIDIHKFTDIYMPLTKKFIEKYLSEEKDRIDLIQTFSENKDKFFENKKEHISQDSVNLYESGNGNLYKYIKQTYDMLHAGDSELKDIYIYSIMGFGVSNLLVPPHISIWGKGEIGKSNLANGIATMLPEKHRLVSNGFSSKALLYLKLRPDILITINNTTFNDETAVVLDGLCDTDAWNKGYIRDVVLENKATKQKIPPNVLFHFSSNKRISGYNYKESGLDGQALESKYISLLKIEDLQQKYDAVDNMLNRGHNKEEVNKRLEVIRGALSLLFSSKKEIDHPKSHKDLLEIGLTPEDGKRRLGRIISLAQGRALLFGKNNIDIEDIRNVFNAYVKIEPKEETNEEENSILSFFTPYSVWGIKELMSTPEFKTCHRNMKYQTIADILKSLKEKKLLKTDNIGAKLLYKRVDWRPEPKPEQKTTEERKSSVLEIPNLLI